MTIEQIQHFPYLRLTNGNASQVYNRLEEPYGKLTGSASGYTMDIAGKMISNDFVNNGEPENVAPLSAGIYFFQINGETVKFIEKQKFNMLMC